MDEAISPCATGVTAGGCCSWPGGGWQILKVYVDAPHGLFITRQKRLNDDLLAFINA